MAARMSVGWSLTESVNALAVPANMPWIEIGTLICAILFWIAIVAWPSETPLASSNEKVVTTKGP